MGVGKNTKLKVLLIQLPHPANLSRNIPLAPAYLKAWAHHCKLLDEVEIEILPSDCCDRSGCQRLIDVIKEKSPDLVGFTLYLWNAARSLYVMEQVKEMLPHVRVVAGGPEVTVHNSLLLDNVHLDFLIFGEGETTFVALLRNLLRHSPKLPFIPGLAFRDAGGLTNNGPGQPLENLELLPSPYLLGYIDPRQYREMMIFTMRGCLQGCSYCAWSARGRLRPFDLEQLREELRLAYALGKETTISIADSAFNTSPLFQQYCGAVRQINRDRRLRLKGFLQAEKISEETAHLLKEANFIGVEVGLQSVSKEVLRNVSRPVDRERFLEGMTILKNAGIPVVVDTILGLPGDTLAGFDQTMAFIAEHRFEASVFNLSIAEGSNLREKVGQFGLEIQEEAPFYVQGSRSFPRADLERAMRRYLSFNSDFNPLHDLRYPIVQSGLYPPISGSSLTCAESIGQGSPITNIVLRLGTEAARVALNSLGGMIAARAASHLSLLCLGPLHGDELQSLKAFVQQVSDSNPFITWDLILEGFDPQLSQEMLDQLAAVPQRKKVFLDYQFELFPDEASSLCRRASNVMAIFPWSAGCPTPRVQAKNCLRKYFFGTDGLETVDLRALLGCHGNALLLEFCADTTFDAAREVMQRISQHDRRGKSIFFTDWVLQRVWEQDFLMVTSEPPFRHELLLDSDGDLQLATVTESDLFWDAISRWGLLRPEYGGSDMGELIMQRISDKLAPGFDAVN